MKETIEKFKDYLIRIGHTSQTYVFPVKKFLLRYSLDEINQENVDVYITEIIKKYKPTYTNSVINSLNCFFKFLKKDIELPKSVKVIYKKPISLDMEWIEKTLFPKIDCMMFENTLKVKALIYFMAYTGVRKSEVYIVKRKDINLDKLEAKIYLKKTKKEHIFIFPRKVGDMLKLYFSSEPENQNAFNLGVEGIDYIFFKKFKRELGKDLHLFPHLMKKTAITHLHSCGFSVEEIAEMVGITPTTIRNHYLDVNLEKIKKTYHDRIK